MSITIEADSLRHDFDRGGTTFAFDAEGTRFTVLVDDEAIADYLRAKILTPRTSLAFVQKNVDRIARLISSRPRSDPPERDVVVSLTDLERLPE